MARVEVHHATLRDVDPLLAVLRWEDRLEIKRADGRPAREVIEQAINESVFSYVAVIDGEIAAIWGVVRWGLMSGSGSPWLVTGRKAAESPRLFMQLSKPLFRQIVRACPNLAVYVDATHHRACRWLKWLGFTLNGPRPHGPGQHPFMLATFRDQEV